MLIYFIFFGIILPYIKSEVLVRSFEIRKCDNDFSHVLIQIELTEEDKNITLKYISLADSDSTTDTEFVNAKCSKKETSVFICYFKTDKDIPKLNITKYNNKKFTNEITLKDPQNISFSDVELKLDETFDKIYKNFQKFINFKYKNETCSLYFIPYMYSIEVSSDTVQKPVKGQCDSSDESNIQCQFNLNSFTTNNEKMIFTIKDKCGQVQNLTQYIITSNIIEINNSKGYNESLDSIVKDITISFDNHLTPTAKSYFSFVHSNNNESIVNLSSNCVSSLTSNEIACTQLSIYSGFKYYLYFNGIKISDQYYILLYNNIKYQSRTEKEIHIGNNIYVYDLMNFTTNPPLNSFDLSSCWFNHTTNASAFFPCKLTENTDNVTSIGPKYSKITEKGDYYLNLSVGQDYYITKDIAIINVQGETVKPVFTDFVGGNIIINNNESYIVMNFNDSTNLDKIENIKMIFPAGGTMSNCLVNITTIKNVLYNLTICNVNSVFSGYALFSYEIFGELVTIPKSFPIYERISSNSGNYLGIKHFFFIIFFLLSLP